jgi:transposase
MSPVTELEAKQAAIIEAQAAKIKALEFQIEKLIAELLLLKNRLFGRSSEAADLLGVQGQLFAPPDVVELVSAVVPAPILPRTPKTSAEQKPQQARREVISPDLPREVRLLDLPESEKVGLVKIGEDTSERLSYTPGTIIVLQTIRPRYADPKNADAGVQQMPVLPSIIPGGILDESVITEFAINKFADHIPLSRSIDRFGRLGVNLALSTVSENLLTTATVWLNPMVDALWHLLKQRTSLHVDETVFPTLPEPGSKAGQTQKTRLWTYLNEGPSDGLDDPGPPIILFHYTDTKAGAHIQKMLINWKDPSDTGCPKQKSCYLHADAASNYEALYHQFPHIKAVNCWAHSRRKFYAIAKESSTRIFAHDAVEAIDVLFAFEREWKTLANPARQEMRSTQSVPQLLKIHAMMSDKLITLAPNSATANAISYLLKRWGNFTRYTERGDLAMSNNAAERALRKAALGRKNFLFAGNERGGEAAAIYYSLIETAKANGINPNEWLLNTLRELPKRKGSSFQDVKDLLPIKGAALL